MKSVPIGKTYSPQERQAMHRWFWRSIAAACVFFLISALISVQQYVVYYDTLQEHDRLKSGTAALHTCLEKKRELKEQVEALDARLAKINGIKYRPKNPAKLLHALSIFSSDVQIDDIALKKKKLDIMVRAQNTDAVLAYADYLKAQELSSRVDVTSIEQIGDRVKAALKVELH